MAEGQSQSYLLACAESLLKNTLQGKRDKGTWRLFPHGFVNLGSTSRPASRLPRVRHTCSDKRGQLTGPKINRDYVFL